MHHVSEIPIASQKSEVVEPPKHQVFNGFHHDCDVDLCLDLDVEASLAPGAALLWTLYLFALEFANVDLEAETIELFVIIFSVPDGRLPLLRCHVILFAVLHIRQLLHVGYQDAHILRVNH